MKGVFVRAGVGAFFATALLLGLSIAFPGKRGIFLGILVLALGVIAIVAILGSLQAGAPVSLERSPFERPPAAPPRPLTPAELERFDRTLVLAATNAFDVHHRLRPLFRQLTAEKLHAGHGVDLDAQPERARELVGDELWELLRPDRELGPRTGPGMPLLATARLVDAVESL